MDNNRVLEISAQSKQERWPYPKTFEALKQAGVATYRYEVARDLVVYDGGDGTEVSESADPQAEVLTISAAFDAPAVVKAIGRHQAEGTSFREFCEEAAHAGVHLWEVDMNARTVTYRGLDGGEHVEQVPGP